MRPTPLGPPKSSLAIPLHPYLDSGSSLAGLLGRYFFTRLLTDRGRKAEPPAGQRFPKPQVVHPRVSPQLFCVSLLHLGPLFHELHISVQQVQPPLRVPLEHL